MTNRPIISVLHPTARVRPSEQFPRGWKDAYDVWLERADHPENIEYVLSVHSSRWADFSAIEHAETEGGAFDEVDLSQRRRFLRFLAVENKGRDCVVDQTNCAYESSSGLLLTGAADDYYPPEHWDTLLLQALHYDVNSEYVIVASTSPGNDARDRELMIGGAATRKVFERRGYILDPDFESMFSDNWWALENRRDAEAGLLMIIERLDIQFDHRHPIFGKQKMDEVYSQQNRPDAYRQGQATFMKKAFGTQVLYACCPGEVFRATYVWQLLGLLLQLNAGNRFMVAPIGFFSSNVYYTRYHMAQSCLECVPAPDLVLWLDDDNILTYEQFNMLYQDLVDHPELSGVVGWCWCDHDDTLDENGKMKPWMMSCGRQGPLLECKHMTQEDLVKAQRDGTMLITSDDLEPDSFWSGFPVVLMRRQALEQIGPQAFVPIVRSDIKFGFTSEDASFFIRAKEAGQKWAVDLRVKVPHIKLRAIEPYGIVTCENQAEFLASKGLKAVPLDEPVMAGAD